MRGLEVAGSDLRYEALQSRSGPCERLVTELLDNRFRRALEEEVSRADRPTGGDAPRSQGVDGPLGAVTIAERLYVAVAHPIGLEVDDSDRVISDGQEVDAPPQDRVLQRQHKWRFRPQPSLPDLPTEIALEPAVDQTRRPAQRVGVAAQPLESKQRGEPFLRGLLPRRTRTPLERGVDGVAERQGGEGPAPPTMASGSSGS